MSRICQKCGGEVGEADFYCIHCGMPLEKVKQEEQQAFSQWEGVQTPSQEKPELAKPLSVKDYLLLGILLSIPVVNIILAILWAAGKNENPNRRNLACAWLIFAAAGAVISVIFMIGLVRAAWLDEQNYPDYPEYYEYYDEYYDDWEEYDYDYDDDMEWEHYWEELTEGLGEI